MPRLFRTVCHFRLDARPRRTARAAPPDDEGTVAERHLCAGVLSPPPPHDRRVITLPGEWRPERHTQGECGYSATTEPHSRSAQDARGTPSPRRHRAGSAPLTREQSEAVAAILGDKHHRRNHGMTADLVH